MQCGETLIGAGVEVIISSDLQRASETAEIIKRALDVELLKTPLLRERSFGQLEGKTNSLLTAENFGIEKNLVVNADARIPGGESLNDLLRRVTEFLAWLELNYRGRSVLLVTHSGTVRALRVAYSQGSFKDLDWGEVPNCSVWELGA
jgi:broad specificity phosphatase PhoE